MTIPNEVIEWQTRVDLAACYQLSAINGWDDGIYTHITAAIPGAPGQFLINPFGLRFDEVRASNLVKIDIHGNKLCRSAHPVNTTGFALHAAIHRARHDAGCVMHLHNMDGVAVSAQQAGLLPLSPYALRFYGELGYHDYEGLDMSPGEQERLVRNLGHHPAMLLRNHGTLTVGRTIAEAFVLMETLDRACAIQLRAQAGGAILVQPGDEVCRKAHLELLGDGAPEGRLEWPAMLRKLDASYPRYRT